MVTGGIEKRGEQNQHFVFHEEGPKAPFDAEGIKGGVCAADGGIWRSRAKQKGEKSPGILWLKGKTRARSTKGESGAFGKSKKPPLMLKALRGVSAQQTGGLRKSVRKKEKKRPSRSV